MSLFSICSQARKPVDLQSGSHVFAVHGWMDSADEFQPDLAAQITPCFDKVFEPHSKRRCFLPRVTRNGEELPPARTLSAASIVTLLAKQWRKCKRKCDCKDLICYKTLIRDKDFLRKLAHWRRGAGLCQQERIRLPCLGERSFYVVLHLSTCPGLLGSFRAGPPGLPCDLRNPLLRVLEQARFFMQGPSLVSWVTNKTPDSPTKATGAGDESSAVGVFERHTPQSHCLCFAGPACARRERQALLD